MLTFSSPLMSWTQSFVVIGLRTLCIATTTVPSDFYETWKMIYYEASTAIHNREKKLEEAAELIEKASGVIYLHTWLFLSLGMILGYSRRLRKSSAFDCSWIWRWYLQDVSLSLSYLSDRVLKVVDMIVCVALNTRCREWFDTVG